MGMLKLNEVIDQFSEQDFNELYENAPCGYVTVTPDGAIVKVNKTFCTSLGLKKTAVQHGRFIQDFLFNPDSSFTTEQFLELVSIEGKMMTFKTSATPVHDHKGTLRFYRLSLLDISEQKKWCNKLKMTSNFGAKVFSSLDFKATLNNITDMVCSDLADGCMIDLFRNQNLVRVAEAHNISEKKIVMMSILKGQMVIDSVLENKVILLNDLDDPEIDPYYREEVLFLKKYDVQSIVIIPLVLTGRKIGAISFINTQKNKIFHEDRIVLLNVLCTHISSALERSRLHESVAAEARNRYDLISLASHKIRTPLTSVKLQLQTTLKKINASDATSIKRSEVERFLDKLNMFINKISEQVDTMIDLNEINKKIELHKERVSLRQMIYGVENSLSQSFEEAGCDVSIHAHIDVKAMLDSSRIKKVVEMVLKNAMNFGKGSPIKIRLYHHKGFAILEVKDYGPTVDTADEFDIFHRKANRLGSIETESLRLELRLSMTIIQEHGGYMEVERDDDGGNALMVYLPA